MRSRNFEEENLEAPAPKQHTIKTTNSIDSSIALSNITRTHQRHTAAHRKKKRTRTHFGAAVSTPRRFRLPILVSPSRLSLARARESYHQGEQIECLKSQLDRCRMAWLRRNGAARRKNRSTTPSPPRRQRARIAAATRRRRCCALLLAAASPHTLRKTLTTRNSTHQNPQSEMEQLRNLFGKGNKEKAAEPHKGENGRGGRLRWAKSPLPPVSLPCRVE